MRKIHKISIVGGTVGVLMAGGIAYAAWTSEGSDTGTVTAGTEQGLVATAGSASGLYPTGDQSFQVAIHNNNPYQVTVDQIAITGVTVENGGTAPGPECVPGDVTAEIVHDGAGVVIGRADASTTTDDAVVLGAVKVTMHADAADNCQGADFKVAVKATAHSS